MNTLTHRYKKKLISKIDKYFSSYEDSYRKIALKLAWWNLKYASHLRIKKTPFHDSIQHIGIYVSGGIGDFLCSAKYIHAFALYLKQNIQIDILSEYQNLSSLKTIFHGKKYISHILPYKKNPSYDLYISLIRFPYIEEYNSRRLSPLTLSYVQAIHQFHQQNPLLVHNGFLGRCYSQLQGRTRENQADINDILNMRDVDFSLSVQEDSSLEKFNLEKNKFITLQTGSGIHFQNIKNEVRQWPLSNYSELTQQIKRSYPEYKIVQLGETCQKNIPYVDIDLRGETTLEELFALLKSSKLHISQEGGMPFMRHFLKGGPSVVLFGPTDEKFFGFPENINITDRKCLHSCEWVTDDWIKKCLKTSSCAECMQNITPRMIMEAINKKGVLA